MELVPVIVIWHVNEMQRHKLIESVFPVFFSHAIANISSNASSAPVSTSDALAEVCTGGLLLIAEELKSDIIVNRDMTVTDKGFI